MPENLVIVESPSKVRTISKILGKSFSVKSCNGHIRDLPKKKLGVNVKKEFEPTYEIDLIKKPLIDSLKASVKTSSKIWLATDEDREGEAISWHLKYALDIPKKKLFRISFNEISKQAIKKAIQSPRKIDQSLVNAQQARRILDRLVGFELSPVLWKRVRRGLSAGRVQSVASKIIVEREQEIRNFKHKISFPVFGFFIQKKHTIKSELSQIFDSESEVENFYEKSKGATYQVASITKKDVKRNPPPPFSTASLQQVAASKLNFSVSQTMRTAQGLYENGYITYMRTDSLRLSDDAKQATKKWIVSQFGTPYHSARNHETKSKSAQEAHEAIRPVDISREVINLDISAQKLYTLIWKRTLASQMSAAILEKTVIKIATSASKKVHFTAKGQIVKFDGFLKLYQNESDDNKIEGLLPKISEGEILELDYLISRMTFSKPPIRYGEASLVKKLEEMGIGRPSTYVPIITTIQNRGYVIKTDKEPVERNFNQLTFDGQNTTQNSLVEQVLGEKNKLFPTVTGETVVEFLESNFPSVMQYSFTAKMEKDFDYIAQGKASWQETLTHFYEPFSKRVIDVTGVEEKVKIERNFGFVEGTKIPVVAKIGRWGPFLQIGEGGGEKENSDKAPPQYIAIPKDYHFSTVTPPQVQRLIKLNNKLIGIHPKTKKTLRLRVSKNGFYIEHGKTVKGEKPNIIGIPSGKDLEDLTIEDILENTAYPKKIGKIRNSEIMVNIGRFGPYVLFEEKFYSIPKNIPIDTVDVEKAEEIIEKKKKEDKEKYIHIFDDGIKVSIGKTFPFLVYKKKLMRLPKKFDVKNATHEDFKNLIPWYNTRSPKSKKK